MRAMVLEQLRTPLVLRERPRPEPRPDEVRIAIEACAVCRTDLHVADGELPDRARAPIAGVVDALGDGVASVALGDRVGVPWLGSTVRSVTHPARTTAVAIANRAVRMHARYGPR